jgi:hypothetical protein
VATEKEMHELIGRAVIDPDFRAKMMTDPGEAAREISITLTSEQVAALKKTEGKGMAVVLDERLPKVSGYIW